MADTDIIVSLGGAWLYPDTQVVSFLWESPTQDGSFEAVMSITSPSVFWIKGAPMEFRGQLDVAMSFASNVSPAMVDFYNVRSSVSLLVQSMRWSGIRVRGLSEWPDKEIEKDLRAAISDVFGDERFTEAVMSSVPSGEKATPSVPAEVLLELSTDPYSRLLPGGR